MLSEGHSPNNCFSITLRSNIVKNHGKGQEYVLILYLLSKKTLVISVPLLDFGKASEEVSGRRWQSCWVERTGGIPFLPEQANRTLHVLRRGRGPCFKDPF